MVFFVLKKYFTSFFKYVVRFISRAASLPASRGRFGEDVAVDFLKNKGYDIIRRNWRYGRAEIDIIAFDKVTRCLVFIEVKLRASHAIVPGYFSVDVSKKKLLRTAAVAFLRKFACRGPGVSCRFDIIEIRAVSGKSRTVGDVFHFENVALF